MRFENTVALITGAEQGIGRAIALAFAARGAAVAIDHPGTPERAEGVRAEAESLGARALAIRADVRDGAQVARMVAFVERELGTIDVLVNNAGIYRRASVVETSDEHWDDVLAVNLRGTFLCSRAVLPGMIARGRGSIVNIASTAIWLPGVGSAAYAASKAGIVAFSRVLALEAAPHGVRVNVVAPGLTDTAQPRGALSEEEFEALGRTVPLGHVGRPEDIAGAVLFLASEDAAYVTGQVLPVNGGRFMR